MKHLQDHFKKCICKTNSLCRFTKRASAKRSISNSDWQLLTISNWMNKCWFNMDIHHADSNIEFQFANSQPVFIHVHVLTIYNWNIVSSKLHHCPPHAIDKNGTKKGSTASHTWMKTQKTLSYQFTLHYKSQKITLTNITDPKKRANASTSEVTSLQFHPSSAEIASEGLAATLLHPFWLGYSFFSLKMAERVLTETVMVESPASETKLLDVIQ